MVTGVHIKLAAFVSSCLYMAYLLHGFMCNSISIGRAPGAHPPSPNVFSLCHVHSICPVLQIKNYALQS